MRTDEREYGSILSLVFFSIGCAVLAWADHLAIAISVYLIGQAVVGEVQRKANQIIDAIDEANRKT